MTVFSKIKYTFLAIVILVLIVAAGWFFIGAENRNLLMRKKVTFFDGDYKITCDVGGTTVYEVNNSKITSDEKGYYFFWLNGKLVQLPINHTKLEEL